MTYSETMVEIVISECKSGFVCYYLGEFIFLIFNNFMFFSKTTYGKWPSIYDNQFPVLTGSCRLISSGILLRKYVMYQKPHLVKCINRAFLTNNVAISFLSCLRRKYKEEGMALSSELTVNFHFDGIMAHGTGKGRSLEPTWILFTVRVPS